jgi:arsenate reductase-like glutaredoxin family protein
MIPNGERSIEMDSPVANSSEKEDQLEELTEELTEEINRELPDEDSSINHEFKSEEVAEVVEKGKSKPKSLEWLQKLFTSAGVNIEGDTWKELSKNYRELPLSEKVKTGVKVNTKLIKERFYVDVASAGAAVIVLEPTKVIGAPLGSVMIKWAFKKSDVLSKIASEEDVQRVLKLGGRFVRRNSKKE